MTGLSAPIVVFSGVISTPWPGRAPSAIRKALCVGQQRLTPTGLQSDAQADLEAHGGTEKALHHYPAEHYANWRAQLGENARFAPGGFGENISTAGMTEEQISIGDIFAVGSARVQVSQGRQPCWKLAAHTGEDRVAYLMRKTLRTGWYLRVLEEGHVSTGDKITLIERAPEARTVQEVTRALFDPRLEPGEAAALAGIETLSARWRKRFAERAR